MQERRVLVARWRRHVLDDGLEEGVHTLLRLMGQVADGPAFQAGAVEHGEVGLAVVGAELDEQVEGLLQRLLRVGAGAVHLVDEDDGVQAQAQRPHQHVARLGHRPLVRVHQQQHGIHHAEHALDLAREIRVAGRVNDVDQVIAPGDGAMLGADGDAALALEVLAVHDALAHLLILAEGAGAAEDGVNQRGLAVVNMRDDGQVANLVG